ncbi:spermidine synthase [Sinomonas cellulolyticus]|uniref:Fused MFS/spermidine synthase n=1 Tax=Sinomonas cellulolyticus TaxID=2801916 RepID=A0ABS1K366_9MICC|nr:MULTISPECIES: fused MFS/spermidine synthase [Sinomonas]MBL0706110.1 fused MFS/spermidine synthase [Sinomonas cellulolyticus]GHG43495.1 spermidine synthase [Sinomonas sp. KCTC 49339]
MARPPAKGPSAPRAGMYPISTGTAELVPDGDSSDGWLLKINGVQSSHVVLSDPLRLDFEYMRWIVALIEDRFDPSSTDRLRVLHQGGGGCSMPRYLAARYPGARQVVVELDAKLADYVREWFDLPKAPLVRIRVGEARAVTESLTAGTRDVVIRDVFAGASTPDPLTTTEFITASGRLLGAGGLFVANIGSAPDHVTARIEAAAIAEVFPHTAIVADPAMLKGRRYGNFVIAGSTTPVLASPALRRRLLGGGLPAQFWDDEQVRAWIGASRPRRDPAADVDAEDPDPLP